MAQSTDMVKACETSFLIASIFGAKGEPNSLDENEDQRGGYESYKTLKKIQKLSWRKGMKMNQGKVIRYQHNYEPTLVSGHEFEATQVRKGLGFQPHGLKMTAATAMKSIC